jgi:hypothetical protein
MVLAPNGLLHTCFTDIIGNRGANSIGFGRLPDEAHPEKTAITNAAKNAFK